MTGTVASPSRRAFLRRRLPGSTAPAAPEAAATPVPPAAPPAPTTPVALIAIVAGRHCLAYRGSFCSVCRERCPVPGAVIVERGLPRIDASACTGCRICHDVCPAPVNAIRLLSRPAPARP